MIRCEPLIPGREYRDAYGYRVKLLAECGFGHRNVLIEYPNGRRDTVSKEYFYKKYVFAY